MRVSVPIFVASFLAGVASLPGGAAPLHLGWQSVDIPSTGSYAMVLLPPVLDLAQPVPVVIFLHGAGSAPLPFKYTVERAAYATGVVAILPRSVSDLGWGVDGDEETVLAALERVADELEVARERVGIAGHSAGGAYAYLLAYAQPNSFSGVFSMSAPFYAITALADDAYVPPIRMYYGDGDPNYYFALEPLEEQWDRLGVPWESDVQPGFGHAGWPQESMDEGFRFLARQRRPLDDGADGGGGDGGDGGGGGDGGDGGDGAAPGLCTPSPTVLCLHHGRFAVTVRFTTASSGGPARLVPAPSDEAGLFWFFDPANWEVLVKVLDGCSVNGHYWVFSAATTDVAYELDVEDLAAGVVRHYGNAAGTPAPALTDTLALDTCP